MTCTNPLSDDEERKPGNRPGDTHAVYGLKQYWRYAFGHDASQRGITIEWTGKARGNLERLAIEKFEERTPNGVATVTLRSPKTRVKVATIPEAKALYALLSEKIQSQSLTTTERKTYHRVRDELVEGTKEHLDRLTVDDLKEGASWDDFERARENQKERCESSSIPSFEEDVTDN